MNPQPPASSMHQPSAPGVGGAWATFGRIVNLHTVAIVFYLALVFVVSRFAIVFNLEAFDEAWSSSFVYLRQTLISGFSVLLAIGLTEALLHGRQISTFAAMTTRVVAVASAAIAGALLRLLVFHGHFGTIQWSWFVPTVGIWLINGGFAHALFWFVRSENETRRQLELAARERDTLAARGVEARLSALQAQIEPHFLFNTLAHVQRLQETQPGRGREMLRSLIDYLRAALPSMRSSGSTLRRELDLARSFLTILQLRMGDRLAFDIRAAPDLLDLPVPPMVLPTLVENAVKHGLAPLTRGGRIAITAETNGDGRLTIEVADDGQGFTAASGSGVGLSNTRSRLAALFGELATLELRAGESAGVVARLVLPMPALQPDNHGSALA